MLVLRRDPDQIYRAMTTPIWTPSPERIRSANITAFIKGVAEHWDRNVIDYASAYEFSVTRIETFWSAVWDFVDIIGEKGGRIIDSPDAFPGAEWFPDAQLNFAENHLRRHDDNTAIIAYTEDRALRTLSWRELYDSVSSLMQAMTQDGVRPGDRVAACLPNVPEAVIAMLATTGLGAIWSACSVDGGAQSLLDRIGQIDPKVLFVAESYSYNGKHFDLRDKAKVLADSIPSLSRVVVVSSAEDAAVDFAVGWNVYLATHPARLIEFQKFPFNHAAFILYSSGTTGKPKAIIHSAGGVLLQTVKGIVLHYDLMPGERIFFPTATGWMVWNVMISALARNATVVLYDGSPIYPRLDAMFDIIAETGTHIARLVPPLIDTYIKAGLQPARSHDLTNLKCFASGSAPLLPHHYEYVYSKVKSNVHLMSPAGGTDTLGTLATGNPIDPVYPGEIQVRSLGMKIEIFNDEGRSVVGEPGELVCTRTFPSVPLGFYGDKGDERLIDAYFSKYPGVWRHGDWAEITPRGGVIIYGRADATLNVNGVRIGTAEIYRGLERVSGIRESVVISQRQGQSERIVLFVALDAGRNLDADMELEIKSEIHRNATLRHVPDKIIQVDDIPKSLNGKPSEIAVREVVHGRAIKNQLGLKNPEALELFRDLPELRSD